MVMKKHSFSISLFQKKDCYRIMQLFNELIKEGKNECRANYKGGSEDP
jgi:hypothetical protein